MSQNGGIPDDLQSSRGVIDILSKNFLGGTDRTTEDLNRFIQFTGRDLNQGAAEYVWSDRKTNHQI
jgi:hypothetical protein